VTTEGKPEPVRETASPSGIDLRPQPEKSPGISGRAAGLIVLTGVASAGTFRIRRIETSPTTGRSCGGKSLQEGRARAIGRSATADPRWFRWLAQTRDPESCQRQPTIRINCSARTDSGRAGIVGRIHDGTAGSHGAHADSSGILDREPPGHIRPWHPEHPCIRQRSASTGGSTPSNGVNANLEFDGQNLQVQKESFLEKAGTGSVADDYLKYTREPPLSRFQIKAGWEIPAALEQGLKALVMSNVYDTATGQYLLIPQGARLVGAYNSRVGYGQNGVQVAGHRVIFPDGSAIDRDPDEHARRGPRRDPTAAGRSCLSEPDSGRRERCRSRGKPTRHTDHTEESQCSADDQDSARLQV